MPENYPDKEMFGAEPIVFQLLTGHDVKIVADRCYEPLDKSELSLGHTPQQLYTIRIYSTEDTFPRKMEEYHELRPFHDYEPGALAAIWEWLQAHVASRAGKEHETLSDFLEILADNMELLSIDEEDTVEHYRHLPEMTLPEAFDRIDDSYFNDQNDKEDSR